ncbi:barstar family protein [Streptomyces sp. H27-D2]|uniref:barstar family protein n=1 Tax=Streptomyces sp. H27-D2 TaxID=3046304 RepID=UPI002DBA40F3|nr:barstar family protein [Streptomyces sp. H27-D2]MEC4015530.1 barstar family protein [Streptomyces sp. H27-D2]
MLHRPAPRAVRTALGALTLQGGTAMTAPEPPGVTGLLAEMLDGTAPPGVLRWPAELPVGQAVVAARQSGWATALLDLDGVRDKNAFMERCARSLRLPGYFGRNWDALADCLTDLSWCPAGHGRLLLIRGWRGFAAAAPDDWNMAERILTEGVGHWRDTDEGLVVLMVDAPPTQS